MAEADPYALAKEHAPSLAKRLRMAADSQKGNEAGFRDRASYLVRQYAERTGIPLEQRDEMTLASGRADTVYNRLVVEYKAPGKLGAANTKRANEEAIVQLSGYLRDISTREKRSIDRLAGVVLDGHYFIFLRFIGGSLVAEEPLEVTTESTQRFLRLLSSLAGGIAIIPENLARDFGIKSTRTQEMVHALYSALESPQDPLVKKLFEQWRIYFSEVAGYAAGSAPVAEKKELSAFAEAMGINPGEADAARLFFAVHTYFAFLMKLLAWLSTSPYFPEAGASYARLTGLPAKALRKELAMLERGGVLRDQLGVRNYLEGDFFGWYLSVWDSQVFEAAHAIIARLADYDTTTLDVNPEGTRDLLKKTYHFLLPRQIRHDLGEYYTPDWLAELTLARLGGLDESSPPPGVGRFLDPACGSGTFLVLAIQAVRRDCAHKRLSKRETLYRVLDSVVGIDLNPLAVTAARTNYLLAIRDLLKFREGEIDLPVYLADSVKIPEVSGNDPGVLVIKTAVGALELPVEVANKNAVDILADTLDQAVHADVDPRAFSAAAERALALEERTWKKAKPVLTRLYRTLRDLHRRGLNGVWSRILKNACAPLFIGQFDYIIGNPPWINWESLPTDYRQDSKDLWFKYGLFPHSGIEAQLGKGKKDISALMTLAVMDRHLKDGGELAFVVTQSLFKTSGAGEGFRRFAISEAVHIRPVHVDDMVELQPFEGATNRTAVVLLVKGEPCRYPVPYTEWKRTTPGRIDSEALLRDVLLQTSRTRLIATPVDPSKPVSAWMTAKKGMVANLGGAKGPSAYTAVAGAYTGGCNGAYWIRVNAIRPDGTLLVQNITENAKRKVSSETGVIEADLVYALARGRDVQRWRAAPSAHIIVSQDASTRRPIPLLKMQSDFRRTFAWFRRFENELRARKTSSVRRLMGGGEFYAMFAVSSATFAPYKVVWKYIATDMIAAVLGPGENGRPVVPDHRLMMVPSESEDEALFVAGMLNSSPSRAIVRGYTVGTQISTHVLEHVAIPRYDSRNPDHKELVQISKAAQTGRFDEHAASALDETAARIWAIPQRELETIKKSLEIVPRIARRRRDEHDE